MNSTPIKRIFGLDVLRSAAILIVVIGHSSFLLDASFKNFPFIPLPDGVDLFFVLSGYLIGTIIIKTVEQNKKFDFTVLLHFLKRRWFRTLPNYFLFLFINIILIYFAIIPGTLNKYLVTFFMFFQNFYKPYDFLFWESWSLVVEEWFYVLFPVAILFLLKFSKVKTKHIFLSAILFFLIFPLCYRLFQSGTSLELDLYYRKLVLTRLDTIGFGLLAAYIHFYHSGVWIKYKNILFIVGIALLGFLISFNVESLFYYKTFYFSLIGLSILLLLPKLESLKTETIPLKPFQFVSKTSYSLYLIHVPLLVIINKIMVSSSKTESVLIYLLFWLVAFLLSFTVYQFYEKPLMNLRDKSK
jgi:peptidoglycan/LPS O-acetylase OafA/YrhL